MKTVFALIGFIILSFLVYLGFYNAFYSPQINIEKEGGEHTVSQEIIGHYHLSDSIMKDVFNFLYEQNGIVITKGFGIYKDNPKQAGENNIHFEAGCIVEDKDTTALFALEEKFEIKKTPYSEYIVSDFPLKGKMSIMIGMYRVYPKLDKFCIKNGYDTQQPVMEIYDRELKKIHYRRKLVVIK